MNPNWLTAPFAIVKLSARKSIVVRLVTTSASGVRPNCSSEAFIARQEGETILTAHPQVCDVAVKLLTRQHLLDNWEKRTELPVLTSKLRKELELDAQEKELLFKFAKHAMENGADETYPGDWFETIKAVTFPRL